MGTQGGGPPNKAKTLQRSLYSSTDEWDKAVGALYDAGYHFDFLVDLPNGDNWVTFTGYAGDR
jgi:hypothetical protein